MNLHRIPACDNLHFALSARQKMPFLPATAWLAVVLLFLFAHTASGQGIRRRALPGAVSLSNQIYADAAALRASGDFLVSAAIARNLNAEAASKEMDNAVKWVSTYFERRQLNREARAAENPGYLDRLEKAKENYRRIHEKGLAATGTDLSDDLNWMLREILANASPSIFLSDQPRGAVTSEYNLPLSAKERHLIRVTEGNVSGGKGMVFRIDTAEMLETRWPVALRDDKFKAARDAFEFARDCAIGDLSQEEPVTEGNRKRLTEAVDRLSSELKAAYPAERRKKLSPREGLAYVDCEKFVRSLAMSAFRLIDTDSSLAFDKSYRFQGESVADLLRHLMSKGLEFAPCEKGGEAVYKKLYTCVRGYYIKFVPKPNE